MKESTKSKLTKFTRLWAVSMVLSIALCIVGVFACIYEHRTLMGFAAIGTFLMFLVMFCQLLTSIIIRRWWSLVGVIFGLILSSIVVICSVVVLAAGQYRPPKREEPNDISDIMLTIASQEDPGELLASIKTAWQQYTRGEAYSGEFSLQDDYLMYADRDENQGLVWTDSTEFRSWDFQDEPLELVAMAHRDYLNGELAGGQYSGLTFYIYDGDTIEWVYTGDYGIEPPEIDGLIAFRLSGTDADITLTASNPEEGSRTNSFVWNGSRFVKSSHP